MKKLFLLLFLAGCGSGYEIDTHYVSCYSKIKYKCTRTKPFLHSDVDLAFCDTKEECIKICDKHRDKE